MRVERGEARVRGSGRRVRRRGMGMGRCIVAVGRIGGGDGAGLRACRREKSV